MFIIARVDTRVLRFVRMTVKAMRMRGSVCVCLVALTL